MSVRKVIISAIFCFISSALVYGQSNLYSSIQSGNLEAVKKIISENPKLLDKAMPYHSYPLHEAASLAQVEVLQWIIEQPGKIKASTKDKNGKNALHHFCRHKTFSRLDMEEVEKIFDLCLKDGVKINDKDKYGETPLQYISAIASYIDKEDVVSKLKYVIEKGAKAETVNNKKKSALMTACAHLHEGDVQVKNNARAFKVIKLLIENGANPKCSDPETGRNPLLITMQATFTTEKEQLDNLKFLIENGADIKAKNKQGESAKSIAKASKNKKLYKVIRKTKKKKRKRK